MTRTSEQIPQSEHNKDNKHRIDRALSWLRKSEATKYDEEKFNCLWIAFNAAYGVEGTDANEVETAKFKSFLRKIRKYDKQNDIGESFLDLDDKDLERKPIRNFLTNRHVYKPFWNYVRDKQDDNWSAQFDRENNSALNALDNKLTNNNEVDKVFNIVFERLYQLRNQVFHGGVTCGKNGWGWIQIKDGGCIMAKIVPVILKIMDANLDYDWGKIAFPRIGGKPWTGDSPS